jgi:hypothetical protein
MLNDYIERYFPVRAGQLSSFFYRWYIIYRDAIEASQRMMLREFIGLQTVDRTLINSSNVLAFPLVQWIGIKRAGHWMGEADFSICPFKP